MARHRPKTTPERPEASHAEPATGSEPAAPTEGATFRFPPVSPAAPPPPREARVLRLTRHFLEFGPVPSETADGVIVNLDGVPGPLLTPVLCSRDLDGGRTTWHWFTEPVREGQSIDVTDARGNRLAGPLVFRSSEEPPLPVALFTFPDWAIDRVAVQAGFVRVWGWILPPAGCRFLSVRLNGRLMAMRQLESRPDVEAVFRSLGDHGRAFPFEAWSESPVTGAKTFRFQLHGEGISEHSPLSDYWYPAVDDGIPLPDADRRERVMADRDASQFLLRGMTLHRKLSFLLDTLLPGQSGAMAVLDWGCGCGNVARYLSAREDVAFFGTDIDPDNIYWCQSHLPRGTYQISPLQPPLPYPDRAFDFIVGISVVTHLDEGCQEAWLRELSRLLKPGGFVVLSVQGLQAMAKIDPGQDVYRLWKEKGFFFIRQPHEIGRIIGDESYYGTAYHNIHYIQDAWSKHFQVCAYLPAGHGHQDLVVLRPHEAAPKVLPLLSWGPESLCETLPGPGARADGMSPGASAAVSVPGAGAPAFPFVVPMPETPRLPEEPVPSHLQETPAAEKDVSAPPVIRIEGLTKTYRLYPRKLDRLKEALHPGKKTYHHEFNALRDVSFSVPAGRTLGIIGKNGSGKSTLLKIVSGVLTPTRGRVEVDGTLSALLELGAGFNPELTGRENVLFLGSLTGRTRSEMLDLWPEIESFADIGEFVDQPVKTYSSGMFVRLAFAAAVHVEPDVLVVDEALAVGDIRFQQKCFRRMREFRESGRTILLVTHDLGAVRSLCDEAVWLRDGQLQMLDTPDRVIREYTAYMHYDNDTAPPAATASPSLRTAGAALPWVDLSACSFFGEGGARITHVMFREEDSGRPLQTLQGGKPVVFSMNVLVLKDLECPIAGFLLNDRTGNHILGMNTAVLGGEGLPRFVKGERARIDFCFRFPYLTNGDYTFSVAIADGTLLNHVQHHWVHDAFVIRVAGTDPAATLGYYLLVENACFHVKKESD